MSVQSMINNNHPRDSIPPRVHLDIGAISASSNPSTMVRTRKTWIPYTPSTLGANLHLRSLPIHETQSVWLRKRPNSGLVTELPVNGGTLIFRTKREKPFVEGRYVDERAYGIPGQPRLYHCSADDASYNS
ncbi:unnamed protein product [Somion occarium]|uniref:Uncharacterized protein n=1 Tax=Somion occarium TaxID=3059160 RepID=A0ABP1E7Q0_9APHY